MTPLLSLSTSSTMWFKIVFTNTLASDSPAHSVWKGSPIQGKNTVRFLHMKNGGISWRNAWQRKYLDE